MENALTMNDDRHDRHSLFPRTCHQSRTAGQWRDDPRPRRPTCATYSFCRTSGMVESDVQRVRRGYGRVKLAPLPN